MTKSMLKRLISRHHRSKIKHSERGNRFIEPRRAYVNFSIQPKKRFRKSRDYIENAVCVWRKQGGMKKGNRVIKREETWNLEEIKSSPDRFH